MAEDVQHATVGDVPGTGQMALFEQEAVPGGLPPNLLERFVVPPFTVLDARQGYWQGRKRAWLSLGIQSELGRGEALADGERLAFGKALLSGNNYGKMKEEQRQAEYEANTDRNSASAITAQHIGEKYGRKEMRGTSVFDPVLCEVAYRWFSPPGGLVLDPFAGGSVRGIVAAKLGRAYTGIDLSPLQVAANEEQAKRICAEDEYTPTWRVGDSQRIPDLLPDGPRADFVFTCPPYFDLEVYSKDKRDISNAGSYVAFLAMYRRIIDLACLRLKPNRFAAIVVGDIRDKRGMYRPFLQDTIAAFEAAGLALYNNAILVTITGSLPVRVGKQFTAGRKLGRTHQYFLTFCKGDPRKATEAVGETQAGLLP